MIIRALEQIRGGPYLNYDKKLIASELSYEDMGLLKDHRLSLRDVDFVRSLTTTIHTSSRALERINPLFRDGPSPSNSCLRNKVNICNLNIRGILY